MQLANLHCWPDKRLQGRQLPTGSHTDAAYHCTNCPLLSRPRSSSTKHMDTLGRNGFVVLSQPMHPMMPMSPHMSTRVHSPPLMHTHVLTLLLNDHQNLMCMHAQPQPTCESVLNRCGCQPEPKASAPSVNLLSQCVTGACAKRSPSCRHSHLVLPCCRGQLCLKGRSNVRESDINFPPDSYSAEEIPDNIEELQACMKKLQVGCSTLSGMPLCCCNHGAWQQFGGGRAAWACG